MASYAFGLISDTHGVLHPDVFDIFDGVHAIFHAGDVEGEDILDELETIAPVFAVQGNCDHPSPRLPPIQVIDAPFGSIVVSHSHLVAGGVAHPKMLAKHFGRYNPRVIIFGHTHRPYEYEHDGIWLINPGPAGKSRNYDNASVVYMQWHDENDELTFDFVPLIW